MSEQKTVSIFPLVVLGFVLRVSGALSPIHEIMHMITVEALGGFVTKLEWSKVFWTRIPEHLFPVVHGSAYWLELVLYSFIILIRQERAAVSYGILAGVLIRGLISTDFATIGSIGNYVIFFCASVGLLIWAYGRVCPEEKRGGQKTKTVLQQIGG